MLTDSLCPINECTKLPSEAFQTQILQSAGHNTYLREMNTDDNKNRKGDYAKKMKRTVYPKSLDGCPKLQNME